jgi:hypothetical protein
MILFTPAWNGKNVDRALKTVKKTTDQTKLAHIATKAKNMYARWAAVEKLTDQRVLAEVANSDKEPKVRLAAIAGLTDQNLLNGLTKIGYEYIGLAAVARLTDRNMLADVAKTCGSYDFPATRLAAVERLTDQDGLADVAENGQYDDARMAAADKLSDRIQAQNVYVDIAKNSGISSMPALERVTDQNAIADVAKKGKYYLVHWEAVKKLSDPELLVDVAKNGKDGYARIEAVEKLSDPILAQEIYTDVAENDEDEGARESAADKLTDRSRAQKIYADLVRKQKYVFSSFAWKQVIEKLTDTELLVDVVKNGRHDKTRIQASRQLIDHHLSEGQLLDVIRELGELMQSSSDYDYAWCSFTAGGAYKRDAAEVLGAFYRKTGRKEIEVYNGTFIDTDTVSGGDMDWHEDVEESIYFNTADYKPR